MALQVEKSFIVRDDETGEEVKLSQLPSGNFRIEINTENGELKEETFEKVGSAIKDMVV